MFRKTTYLILLFYGILLIGTGVFAYLRKGSVISLAMGGGLGSLIVLSAFLLSAKKKAGIYLSVFLTLTLSGTFAVRYLKTQSSVPAILAILSGAMLIFLITQIAKKK